MKAILFASSLSAALWVLTFSISKRLSMMTKVPEARCDSLLAPGGYSRAGCNARVLGGWPTRRLWTYAVPQSLLGGFSGVSTAQTLIMLAGKE